MVELKSARIRPIMEHIGLYAHSAGGAMNKDG